MGPIDFVCPGFGRLHVYGERLHSGHDFICRSNAQCSSIDDLLFFDSRGISGSFDGSLAQMLISEIERSGRRYLFVSRPLELTTWATLLNFMRLNEVCPGRILTNMGFVDFTPKKIRVLQDTVLQVDFAVGHGLAEPIFAETYRSSSGEDIALYSLSYAQEYRAAIQELISEMPTVIINTPLVDEGIKLERKRPRSFFTALNESNNFNHSIRGVVHIDLPLFDASLTYDAVHYTPKGNEFIFNLVKDHL